VFRKVRRHEGSACGRALTSGKTVLIENVEHDEEFKPFRAIALEAGYRSVLTTPLMHRGSELTGVLATHFGRVHRPTPIEIDTFERYSRVAAEHLRHLLTDECRPLDSIATRLHDRLYGRL
jgi:GAF domain-containing protein